MEKNKTALVTGATGQSGSYMSELLLFKGYKVYALVRRSSTDNLQNLRCCIKDPNFNIIIGDMCDQTSLFNAVAESKPDEIYNFAAQSHVHVSFSQPKYTADCVAIGVLNLLEVCRLLKFEGKILQASSSEMFGNTEYGHVQNEDTPFAPRSPYAASKLFAHNMCILYRNYGLQTYCPIFFNKESPRRSLNFVTRKITSYVAKLAYLSNTLNTQKALEKIGKLKLGNIDSCRDWSFSPEVVRCAYKMVQDLEPCELVISSDRVNSVREFLDACFGYAGFSDWEKYVEIDQSLFRPNDVTYLHGDSSKASELLGWKPNMTMESIAESMLRNDFKIAGSKIVYDENCIL